MRLNFKAKLPLLLVSLIVVPLCCPLADADNVDTRRTPLVRAIQDCSASVVNLRGRKTVKDEELGSSTVGQLKQVNGMGTGVVIDPRGYVLTNYHVVEGVKTIQVTTSDGTKTVAKLIAHDPETDLAVLKIDLGHELPVIKIGSSSDLMLAETVAAVGNAYGYEHTVTVGIISQLRRTVQVNEEQVYRNLIQTDAPINPGNSGGPLLNLNGEMIGINVAVRIGAQGIAFAIPVNDALQVAADMMAGVVAEKVSHGLTLKTVYQNDQPALVVERVEPGSNAAKAGVQAGDRLTHLNGTPISRELDFYRQLVEARPSQQLKLDVATDSEPRTVKFQLAKSSPNISDVVWSGLGLRLVPANEQEMKGRHPNYTRGLRVTRVRTGSAADDEGIIEGDILVAMHGWKTESMENLAYVLDQPDIKQAKEFMFYILRDKEPFWGQMRIASRRR